MHPRVMFRSGLSAFVALCSLLLCAIPARPRTIAVIAHRGAHTHNPENTVPAFRAAIAMGADYFECDVRETADGKLVIMHDSSVGTTTNGSGRVEDMTFLQVRALDAGAKFNPSFVGTKVPTFAETLRLARGKIGVYVDAKDRSTPFAAAVVHALDRYGMAQHAVVYGYSLAFFRDIVRLDPRIRIMPEAVNATVLAATLREFHPRVIAFGASDFTPVLVRQAKRAGAKIFVDRLGPFDNPAGWQGAVSLGTDGIQTNHPAALLNYLRAHGEHR